MGKGKDNCSEARGIAGLLDQRWRLPDGVEEPETTIPGVGAAAQHIAQALLAGKRIAVFADYDADGTSSAAILRMALEDYQDQILWGYARSDRGTGLDPAFVRMAHKNGVDTLVTLDLGSGQPGAADLARELGMHTVITDHHHPHPDLRADYHLNPQLHTPGHQASGANVAYKLALQLQSTLQGQVSDELVGRGAWLAGFAARADLMDLSTPENQALEALTSGRSWAPPGLRAAASELGLPSLSRSNQSRVSTLLNLPKRTPLAQAAWSSAILSAPDETSAKHYIKQLVQVREKCQDVQREYLGIAWGGHERNHGSAIALAHIQEDDSHLFAGYAGLVALQYARSSGAPAAVFIPQDKEKTRYKWSLRTGKAEVGERGALTLAERLRDLPAPDGSSPAGGHAQAMGGVCSAEQVDRVKDAMRQWAAELGLPEIKPED